MIQIRKKIENISYFQSEAVFQEFLVTKLQPMKKQYCLSDMSPFYGIIRQMTMCLITDFYILRLKIQGDEAKLMKELQEKKTKFFANSKQIKSALIFQGKMRENTKYQQINLVVTKMTFQILFINKESTSEDQIFQRLNFIYTGCRISNHCFRVSQVKLGHNLHIASKIHRKLKKQNPSPGEKQNNEFRKTFLSVGQDHQKPIIKNLRRPLLNQANTKISKLIHRVEETIKIEQKKVSAVIEVKAKNTKNHDLYLKLFDEQQQANLKPRRASCLDPNKIMNLNRIKRLGTLEKQPAKCRFLEIKQNMSSYSQLSESAESVPNVDENWYKPEKKLRVKRTFTVYLPSLNQQLNQKN